MSPRRIRYWIAGALVAHACLAGPALAEVTFGGRVDVPVGGTAKLWDAAPTTFGEERATVAITTSDPTDVLEEPVDLVLLHIGADGTVIADDRVPVTAGDLNDVELADVDRDGDLDVLLVDGDADAVLLILRTGDGLAPAVPFPSGERPQEVTAGDIDGDGHLDLVVTLEGAFPDGDPAIVRLMGDGAGSFGPPQLVLTTVGPLNGTAFLSPKLVDLNGNENADLVVRMHRPATSGTGVDVTTVIMLADGSGGFGVPFERPGGLFRGLTGELTGDGAPELVYSVPDYCSSGLTLPGCTPNAGSVLSGAAPPGVPTPRSVGQAGHRIVGVADLDGAAPEDLLYAGNPATADGTPYFLGLSLGGGEFAGETPLANVTDMDTLIPVDLNGDGAADLFGRLQSATDTVSLFLNRPVVPSASLDLGEVAMGTTSATRALEVRNDGAAPLALGAAALEGAAAADYELVENGCSGTTVGAGGRCAVQVRFRPGAPGSRPAQLALESAGAGIQRFALSGAGLAVPGPAAGSPRCLSAPAAPEPSGEGEAASVELSAAQLRTNQRIGQAAIRRLNAVEAWLAAGIQARDLCGGAIGSSLLAPGVATAEALADVAAPSLPDPRPVTVAGGDDAAAEGVRLSAGQMRINQRIYQAAIRRAAALEARLAGKLTGGDLAAGALTQDKLAPRLRVLSAAPAATEPAPSRTKLAARPPGQGGEVAMTAAQLRINQRIAQAAVRRANALVARLEAGLPGEAFAAGSITTRNLAPGVVQP